MGPPTSRAPDVTRVACCWGPVEAERGDVIGSRTLSAGGGTLSRCALSVSCLVHSKHEDTEASGSAPSAPLGCILSLVRENHLLFPQTPSVSSAREASFGFIAQRMQG